MTTTAVTVTRIYLVDYGNDFERWNIGAASTLEQAQEVVRDYLQSPEAQYMIAPQNAGYYWAGVTSFDTDKFGKTDEGTFVRLV